MKKYKFLEEERFLREWKNCIVPFCKAKVCTWASIDMCFQHRFYGKKVSKKRIKRDRKKGLIP